MTFAEQLPDELRDLVRRARTYMRTNPTQFDMDDWYQVSGCRTVMCIGGTMAALADPIGYEHALERERKGDTEEFSAGVTTDPLTCFFQGWFRSIPREFEEAFDRLFHVSHWPLEFVPAGYTDPSLNVKVPAALALKRMDYWLEHGE